MVDWWADWSIDRLVVLIFAPARTQMGRFTSVFFPLYLGEVERGLRAHGGQGRVAGGDENGEVPIVFWGGVGVDELITPGGGVVWLRGYEGVDELICRSCWRTQWAGI